MQGFQVQHKEEDVIITINRKLINMNTLENILERLRVDYLAQQVDFNENILTLGNEIKRKWWEQNGKEFLQGIEG
jgi:hypothetical protein